MDPNLLTLGALALDLKRIAMGLYHQSSIATRFATEAIARKKELDTNYLPKYIINLLDQLEDSLTDPDKSLTLSTLFQNYVTHKLKHL